MEKQKWKRLILGINVLVIMVYTLFIYRYSEETDPRSAAIVYTTTLFIGIHASLNFIMAFLFRLTGKKEHSQDYTFYGLMVLLIGFSACIGSLSFV
ncbi:MAG: hypothetical protein AAF242_17335 [Bacteroidota bacterium]